LTVQFNLDGLVKGAGDQSGALPRPKILSFYRFVDRPHEPANHASTHLSLIFTVPPNRRWRVSPSLHLIAPVNAGYLQGSKCLGKFLFYLFGFHNY
jgi:hypothetical protein